MSSFSEPVNYIIYFVKKITTYIININSKTIKKHGRNKKFLRQDKNYCLVCKTHTKHLLAYNAIVKIGKREMATQLTKCNKCQINKLTF